MSTQLIALPGGRDDPERVLRGLELTITRRLTGLLQGDHQSLLLGPGSEPGESRRYEPGDDVRRIDWPLTARSNVAHVRTTIADRELETWAVVDGSSSMEFGTALCTKRDLALAAVAALGFMSARPGNRFGVVLLDPSGTHVVPARPGRAALMGLLRTVATRPTAAEGSQVDLAAAIRLLQHPSRRRGLAVVVSDFLCDSPWERALRAAALRHEVLAVEIIDPRELELPDVGFLTLVDPETGRLREVHTSRGELRARYAAAARAQRAATAAAIGRAGALHLVLRTDRDWLRDTAAFVLASRRTAMARARR
jgi:uncharacterized protein (DUF58 family)